jgi:hypothetical protein
MPNAPKLLAFFKGAGSFVISHPPHFQTWCSMLTPFSGLATLDTCAMASKLIHSLQFSLSQPVMNLLVNFCNSAEVEFCRWENSTSGIEFSFICKK